MSDEDPVYLLGREILNSDSEEGITHPSSSSGLKRQRTAREVSEASTVFQNAVDVILRYRLPLPASVTVSVGTLQGTAHALDRLPSAALLVRFLSPPYGNCYQYCQLSLLIHRIRGFLMTAPTVHTCGFKETRERGWIYSCNSLPCLQCNTSGDALSPHLLLLLLEFVESMMSDPVVSEPAHVIPRLSQIATQCRLVKLGPYSLTIPLELKCELTSFILAFKQLATVPTTCWPDVSSAFLPRQLPIQSKGSVDDHISSHRQGHPMISSKLQKGAHIALLFYCETYSFYRNNEFCQNDIKALTLILQSCFHYTVVLVSVRHSQDVFAKLEDVFAEIQPDKDVVFVYFSCHGSAEALFFTEAIPEALGTLPPSSYLELTDLLEFLMGFQIRNLTIFYDSCRNSIPFASERGCSKFHPSPTLPGVFQIHPAAGFPAYESHLLGSSFTINGVQHLYKGHGFFTWCLLKALCWLCSKNNPDTGPIQSSTLFTCLVYWQATFRGTHSVPGFDSIAQVPLQQTSQGSVVYISNSPRAHWEEATFSILTHEIDEHAIYVGWLGAGLLWLQLAISIFGSLCCDLLVSLDVSDDCHTLLDRFLTLSWLIVTIVFAFRAELIWLPIFDFRSRKPIFEELKLCRDELRKKNRFQHYLLHRFSVLYAEINTYGNQLHDKRLSLWTSVKGSLRLDLKTVQLSQLDELVAACEGMLNSTTLYKYINRDPLVVVLCAVICLYFFSKHLT